MKKIALMSVVVLLLIFSCHKEESIHLETPLNFQDLRLVSDSNLSLEDVVVSYSQYQDEDGNYLPYEAYTNVLYKGVVLKSFNWVIWQAPIAKAPYIFWAKTEN